MCVGARPNPTVYRKIRELEAAIAMRQPEHHGEERLRRRGCAFRNPRERPASLLHALDSGVGAKERLNTTLRRKGLALPERTACTSIEIETPAKHITRPNKLVEGKRLSKLHEAQLGTSDEYAAFHAAEILPLRHANREMTDRLRHRSFGMGRRGNMVRPWQERKNPPYMAQRLKNGLAVLQDFRRHLARGIGRRRRAKPIGESRYAKEDQPHSRHSKTNARYSFLE